MHVAHVHADVVDRPNQSARQQFQQGFSNDRLRDAELAGELELDELLFRRELAGQDHAFDGGPQQLWPGVVAGSQSALGGGGEAGLKPSDEARLRHRY